MKENTNLTRTPPNNPLRSIILYKFGRIYCTHSKQGSTRIHVIAHRRIITFDRPTNRLANPPAKIQGCEFSLNSRVWAKWVDRGVANPLRGWYLP